MKYDKKREDTSILYLNESQKLGLGSTVAESSYGTQRNKNDLQGTCNGDDGVSEDRLNKATLNDSGDGVDIGSISNDKCKQRSCLIITTLLFSLFTTAVSISLPHAFYTKEAEGRNISVSMAGLVRLCILKIYKDLFYHSRKIF